MPRSGSIGTCHHLYLARASQRASQRVVSHWCGALYAHKILQGTKPADLPVDHPTPAQYVKAYLKRNKHDAADAEAICEAVARPTMRFVAVKTAEQQAAVLLHRGRERLVRQRTGLVNALRAHLAEFGIIAPQGLRNVGRLIAIVRDEGDARLPDLARQVLEVLAAQIEQLEASVAAIEKQLMAWHKSNPVSQRLATIP